MNYGKSAYLKVIELEKKQALTSSSNSEKHGYVEFDKTNLSQTFSYQNSFSTAFPKFEVLKGQEICFEIKITLNVITSGTFNVGLNVNNSRIYSESKEVETGYNDFIMFKTYTPLSDADIETSLDFYSETSGFSGTIDDIKVIILGIHQSTVYTDLELRALKVSENKALISYIDSNKIYYNLSDISAQTISNENFTLLNDALSHCFTLDTLSLPQNYDQSKVYLLRVDLNKNLYISNYFISQSETLIDTSVSCVHATACPSTVDDSVLIVYIKNGEIYFTSIKNGNLLTSKKLNLSSSNFQSVYAITRSDSDKVYILATDKNNSNYIIKSVIAKELSSSLDNISVSCDVIVTKYVDVAVCDRLSQETIKINSSLVLSSSEIYDRLIENQCQETIKANVSMAGEEYEIPSVTNVIYGVKLDRTLDSNQPLGKDWATYTDDAVGLSGAYMDFANDTFVDNGWYNRWPFNQIKPCIVKNGAVVGYLDPDDYTKYTDGSSAPNNDKSAGNVMIEIPKIYYKISTDSQYNYIQISNQTFTGACCLAHVYKGQELSKIYVDAYLSSGTDYQTYGPYSISGSNPGPEYFTMSYENVYPTIKSFRGNRCEPLTYNIFTLIGCLYAVMFKSTNCRLSLGKGLYKYSENGVTTGVLDKKGFCYGENTNSNGNITLGRIKLFGMEDYYGAKYTFCTGLYVDANKNYRIMDPYDSTLEYSPTGVTSFPINNPNSTDLMPFPESSSLIPVKLTGMNALGFARTNQNTLATDVSTSSDVGFCSKTKYSSTGNYTVGLIATSFNNDAGVYAFQTFTKDATSRRAFRIVYFPNES